MNRNRPQYGQTPPGLDPDREAPPVPEGLEQWDRPLPINQVYVAWRKAEKEDPPVAPADTLYLYQAVIGDPVDDKGNPCPEEDREAAEELGFSLAIYHAQNYLEARGWILYEDKEGKDWVELSFLPPGVKPYRD